MVFVSLEAVVGAPSADRKSQSARSVAPVRVVVTPGSAAKCSARGPGAHTAASSSSSRSLSRWWRGDRASHFVCFVTDGVVRHKWVVVKRAAEGTALRRRLLRATGDCKRSSHAHKSAAAPCSCRAVRALAKASPGAGTKALDAQYGQAHALEELLNALLGEMLADRADSSCAAAGNALAAVEAFLDVEARRAEAVDRLVRQASACAEGVAGEEESPEQPSGSTGECCICCQALSSSEARRLPCGHAFHADCVCLWLKRQQTCPECHVAARVAV